MKKEALTLGASALSGSAGLLVFIEENATVINTLISFVGVLFAFIFGAVGCYSVYITRKKDKAIKDNEIETAKNKAAIRELQQSRSTDKQ